MFNILKTNILGGQIHHTDTLNNIIKIANVIKMKMSTMMPSKTLTGSRT